MSYPYTDQFEQALVEEGTAFMSVYFSRGSPPTPYHLQESQWYAYLPQHHDASTSGNSHYPGPVAQSYPAEQFTQANTTVQAYYGRDDSQCAIQQIPSSVDQQSVEQYIRQEHDAQGTKYYCVFEGCTYHTRPVAKRHVVSHVRCVHLQERQFICVKCNVTFARKTVPLIQDATNLGTMRDVVPIGHVHIEVYPTIFRTFRTTAGTQLNNRVK
ncbi:hypothetical protein BU17DRAFT_67485 [Hysterangium stoloniferum]|nr:hypothetical protein BU17DRAFT_67485 [Hysterangium stoloniferum]